MQLVALDSQIERLRAEETLREKGTELTPESLRSVVLAATGSQDEADRAYSERVLALAKAKVEG